MNKKEYSRAFEGIWIARELWLDKDMSWGEKLLFLEIKSLAKSDKGCFASNGHFADFLGKSEDRVSRIIASLKKKGYINTKLERNSTGQVIRRYITLTVKEHEERLLVVKNNNKQNGENADNLLGENADNLLGENAKGTNTVNNTNTVKDIKDNVAKARKPSKVKYEESNVYFQTANVFKQLLIKNGIKVEDCNMQTWSDNIRKLVELRKQDLGTVKDMIVFVTNNEFWKGVCLSPSNLLKNYVTIHAQMLKNKNGQKKYQAPIQQAPSKVEFVKLEPDNNGFDGTNLSYEFMNRGIDNDTLIAYYKKQVEITGKGVFDGKREIPLKEWIEDFQMFNTKSITQN